MLAEEEIRRRLAAARVAVLATTARSGSPHAVPFCFVLAGDEVLSAVDEKPKSTRRLARLENIRRDPRVAVLVHEWSEDWSRLWWVRADGRGRVLEPGPESARAVGLLAEKYPQYRERPPRGPVLAIKVERWTGWSAK